STCDCCASACSATDAGREALWFALREDVSPSRLASCLGHGHDLEQVAVGVLEVQAAPAPARVDQAVGVVVRLTSVRDAPGLHAAEDRLELCLADVERVVMAPARAGVEARPAPGLRLVGEIQRQALVDSYLGEVARLDRQTEELGEERRRGHLVFR